MLERKPDARRRARAVPIIRRLDERLRAQGHEGLCIVENHTIHMANLAVACTHCTNGVAELHTHILKERVFVDWAPRLSDRLQNVTNGITPGAGWGCAIPS